MAAPPKKPLRGRPGAKKPGPQQPIRPPPRPRDPHATKLIDKDEWGYNFAQAIWKLDPGAERMKRAPEDRERERVNAFLKRVYALDAKQLTAGFSGESLSWGMFREDKKTPRLLLAEHLRAACLKARGSMLGIFQTHFLAHKFNFLQTLRLKSPAQGFPLELEVKNAVMLEGYEVGYALQIDRVFYPVFSLPKATRFVEPLVVADAYRLLDGRGESMVRTPKKNVLLSIESDPHSDPKAPFEWKIMFGGEGYTLKEPIGRQPQFTMTDASGAVVASLESNLAIDARAIDVTLRVEVASEPKAWIGLASVYLDAYTQRAQGILGRARDAAEAKEKALAAEAIERK